MPPLYLRATTEPPVTVGRVVRKAGSSGFPSGMFVLGRRRRAGVRPRLARCSAAQRRWLDTLAAWNYSRPPRSPLQLPPCRRRPASPPQSPHQLTGTRVPSPPIALDPGRLLRNACCIAAGIGSGHRVEHPLLSVSLTRSRYVEFVWRVREAAGLIRHPRRRAVHRHPPLQALPARRQVYLQPGFERRTH